MPNLTVLELFSGSGDISKRFRERGHQAYTVDFNLDYDPDLVADVETLSTEEIIILCGKKPDVIWASPDCTTYSVAGIGKHRRKDYSKYNKSCGSFELSPKSEYAKKCDSVNIHLIDLINELKPKYFFIENPVGGLRKMPFMANIPRYTVTYCQYGDTRMKPTDIWTNHPDPKFKPPCHKGDKCHVAAPRGSPTGTNGMKCAYDRARIPMQLIDHIIDICEE